MTASVNNRLSEILEKRRIKITDLARETGISRTTLTQLYYRRGSGISFDVLHKLCLYFNVSAGDILFLDEIGGEPKGRNEMKNKLFLASKSDCVIVAAALLDAKYCVRIGKEKAAGEPDCRYCLEYWEETHSGFDSAIDSRKGAFI